MEYWLPETLQGCSFPKGLVSDHWDGNSSSWSIIFLRLLKDDETIEFQNLLSQISSRRVIEPFDRRWWSLEASESFLVKSLSIQLSPSLPLDKLLFKALWKTKSPRRVNILLWVTVFGQLNYSSILQRKLPSHSLSPSICPMCEAAKEDLQHLFFECSFVVQCWWHLFSFFKIAWVFGMLVNF